jgi:uncharacterized protein YukE
MRFIYRLNFIRIFLATLTLAIAGFSIFLNKDFLIDEYQSSVGQIFPCKIAKEFSIGNVDPKFNITQKELEELSIEAKDIWNQAVGREVLKYNPNSKFRINLIFDERQIQTMRAGELNENLKELESSREVLLQKYGNLQNAYDQKIKIYNNDAKAYKEKLDQYNKEVEHWNNQGGAPEKVYDKLKKEKKELGEIFEKLEKQRLEVNELAGQTNNLAIKENEIVQRYNEDINTYKSEFGDSREFEKGVFDREGIDIYQFQEKEDLRLTLIHELGHYLGLQHVSNPESVMYYLIGDQDLEIPKLTKEDLEELKKICKLK